MSKTMLKSMPLASTSITTMIVTVTPAMAQDWLDNHNHSNRPISGATVALYARLMRTGRWALNGETLSFDVNGNLLNGQHRLTAVVLADVTIDFLVVRGLPPEARDTVDAHRKRTAADVLGMHGIKRGNAVAGIARVINQWDQGLRTAQIIGGGQNMLSAEEVLDFVAKEPLILQAVEAALVRDAQRLAPVRAMGTFWVLTHRVSFDHADEFYSRLLTGEMLKAGDPILTLRRYWTNLNERNNMRGRSIIRTGTTFNYLQAGARAWNAWARGESLRNITWKTHSIPELLIPSVPVPLAELPADA